MKILLALALLCVTICYASAQSTFIITDLGALPGDTESFPIGVNNRGDVTVTSISADFNLRAFLWHKGTRILLGSLGGGTFTIATGINEIDQVVGVSTLPDDLGHAFLWEGGTMMDLGTLGGNSSAAYWINNRHQVVGEADTSFTNPLTGGPLSHAFLEQRGLMSDIGTAGGYHSLATAINDRGQITGVSDITKVADPDARFGGAPVFHAFLWQRGVMRDLGGLLGGKFSWGLAIDNHGRVVGMADTEGDTTAHAFLWTNGGARDLGTLDGDMVSWGYGINDKGQVVGTSASEPSAGKPLDGFKCPCRAFIWENGQMTNLQRLIPIDSGIRLTQALWINERGQIVTEGWVRPRKDAPPTRRAFLLTPKTQIP